MSAQILDLTDVRFSNENEIDNAIYAVLAAAFCEGTDEPQVRRSVRARLGSVPTAAEVVEAACAELKCRGRLSCERQRRSAAAQILAAFLDLSPQDRADVSLAPAPRASSRRGATCVARG
jgi:hypothetical protein